MKRESPSIKEEVEDLAGTVTAARERVRALQERLRIAPFAASDSDTKRLLRELDSEESSAEDARKKLEAIFVGGVLSFLRFALRNLPAQ